MKSPKLRSDDLTRMSGSSVNWPRCVRHRHRRGWRVVDFSKTANPSGVRECVLVADDRDGYQLYYDPIAREFFLAMDRDPPESIGVDGDAVGCFMAR